MLFIQKCYTASWLFYFQNFLPVHVLIEWDPPEPEPFYQPTGYEQTPLPGGEEKGITVYCVDSGNTQHADGFLFPDTI